MTGTAHMGHMTHMIETTVSHRLTTRATLTSPEKVNRRGSGTTRGDITKSVTEYGTKKHSKIAAALRGSQSSPCWRR